MLTFLGPLTEDIGEGGLSLFAHHPVNSVKEPDISRADVSAFAIYRGTERS